MSTYKIYQIIDANKSTYSFRLPDSKKHVDFLSMTFGSKFADGKLTYGTDDADIQAAIENMPKFKSGVITIEREVETSTSSVTDTSKDDKQNADTSKQQAASGKQSEGKGKGKGKGTSTSSATKGSANDASTGSATDNGDGLDNEVIEKPTTAQEAKDWLKTTKGIAPVALNSIEKVKAQAEKAGVTFPNVVWD